MTVPSSLLENSEWMVAAVAAALLVIIGLVSLAAFSRVSRLAKHVEKHAREVGELHSLEDRRLLKELKAKHGPGEKNRGTAYGPLLETKPSGESGDRLARHWIVSPCQFWQILTNSAIPFGPLIVVNTAAPCVVVALWPLLPTS